MKIQKTVYIELTLVLTRVCPTWATPQPLFSSYHLPYSLGGVKIKSPLMRPLS